MRHDEWQSDAPAPEEQTPWSAPRWMVNSVMIAILGYLIVGIAIASLDSASRSQVSGPMVPISYVFEVFLWPLQWILPAWHYQSV